MKTPTRSQVRWLDFSGAPPLVVPQQLAALWRGATEPENTDYCELNTDNPVTDYDRACAVSWPGKCLLEFKDAQVLALYTEFDNHAWDESRRIVACGGWLPSDEYFRQASWTDPIQWCCYQSELLLMNSAADGVEGLSDDDFMPVNLPKGIYTVECAYLEAEYVGYFYKFIWRRPCSDLN